MVLTLKKINSITVMICCSLAVSSGYFWSPEKLKILTMINTDFEYLKRLKNPVTLLLTEPFMLYILIYLLGVFHMMVYRVTN